ncbi:MAG: hypothetical protein PVJ30_01740, partial [Thiohalocapsa sp.]
MRSRPAETGEPTQRIVQDGRQPPARIECRLRILKHVLHAAAIGQPLRRRQCLDILSAPAHGAAARFQQPGGDACERRLAAAGLAHQSHGIAGPDGQIHVRHRRSRGQALARRPPAAAAAVGLPDTLQREQRLAHALSSSGNRQRTR